MSGKTWLLTAAVILSNLAGNFVLSWGMKHAPAGAGPVISLMQPAAVLGIALLIAWTLMRIRLLGLADLTFVLPVTSIGYVLNVVAGSAFLQEQVSWQRWLGALLICGGAALTSRTDPASAEPRV
jgi:uncharacterized membrane protein